VDRGEILRRVMPRIGTANTLEADRDVTAVLAALADAISPDEAYDLGSQLPDAYRDVMMERMERGGAPQPMDRQAFLSRIQRELGLESREQAERIAAGVVAVLKEAVTPGEIDDIARQLSPELRAMVEAA